MKRRVSFEFADTGVNEALRFLNALTGVSFVLDPEAVATAETPRINLQLTDATLESALKHITNLLGLDYTLRDEAVWITTPEKAIGEPVLRLYDVSDLTIEVRDFRGNTQAIRLLEEDEGPWNEPEDADEIVITGQQLVEFILRNIRPESWAGEEYGGEGRIAYR